MSGCRFVRDLKADYKVTDLCRRARVKHHWMVEELRLAGTCRSVRAPRVDVERARRVSRVPDATTPLCRHGALVHKGARRGQFTTAWSARNPLTGLNS